MHLDNGHLFAVAQGSLFDLLRDMIADYDDRDLFVFAFCKRLSLNTSKAIAYLAELAAERRYPSALIALNACVAYEKGLYETSLARAATTTLEHAEAAE